LLPKHNFTYLGAIAIAIDHQCTAKVELMLRCVDGTDYQELLQLSFPSCEHQQRISHKIVKSEFAAIKA
jgi:hypothetical protein